MKPERAVPTIASLAPRSRRANRASVCYSACLLWVLCLPAIALASFDLEDTVVTRLENGLTVMLLEHRGIPAVSVQVLYRVGGRNEQYGGTGLAHFLEHMAFRDSENFPDTQLVSSIYSVGGEWHGYTWVDQTTYFETVPADRLDLALRIEADRMQRLLILEQHLEPERGAVLAEMHGYENDPAMVLHDQVVFAAFQGHPYRNNVIGFESDIQQVSIGDVRDFYHRHYQASNAVLAVVGDMSAPQVLERVTELFGAFESSAPTPLPRTQEPMQAGVRRVSLAGATPQDHFEVLYHAPSARHPDFPVFLVLQELLGGSSGVNFHQDGGVAPVLEGRLLDGVAGNLRTWFPPAAQTYGFSIAGSMPPGSSQEQVEQELESRLALVRDAPIPPGQIETARNRVRQALIFDLQTTEDAAHQLAYFDGLGALPVLLGLADSVSRVTSDDLMRVAAQYFDPARRTLGWYRAGVAPGPGPQASLEFDPVYGPAQAGRHGMSGEPTGQPQLHRLASGLPVILQRAPASPTMHLRMVFGSGSLSAPSGMSGDDPSPGYSSLNLLLARGDLASGLGQILQDLQQVRNEPMVPEATISDPAARLQRLFLKQSGWDKAGSNTAPGPILVSLVGDIDPGEALALLQSQLAGVTPGERPVHSAPRDRSDPLEVRLDHPVAQEGLGYLVAAPGPRDPSSMAWRALLYILSHGYEGRLGKEAISRQGLVYYIDGAYRSDGEHGWISLATGVDPSKYDAMQILLQNQLQELQSKPPGSEELAQARQHMAGRYQTAAQSNQERSGELAREWLWYGRLRTPEEVKESIESVSVQQVLDAVPGFLRGNIVSVRSPYDSRHAVEPQSEGPIGRDD